MAETPDTPPEAEAVTAESLEALTRDQIHEDYNVPLGVKADMINAVLNPAPEPPAKTTVLALVGASKYDTFTVGDTVIKTEAEGATEVPSADVDAILAAAEASGVTVQKVS